jgi:hypothetical protein
VQRVGDYDGYGTPNTPVRMAAQYRHTALAGVSFEPAPAGPGAPAGSPAVRVP